MGNEKMDPDIQCPNHLMRMSCVKCGLVVEDRRYPHNMTREQWRHELAARTMAQTWPWPMKEHEGVSKWAYERADVMLKEGDK